jgi:hypothetical protein
MHQMVLYLVFVDALRAIMTGLAALFCAVAGLTLFRVPMWQ